MLIIEGNKIYTADLTRNKIYTADLTRVDFPTSLIPITNFKKLGVEVIDANHIIVHNVNSESRHLLPRVFKGQGIGISVDITNPMLPLSWAFRPPFHMRTTTLGLEIEVPNKILSPVLKEPFFFSGGGRVRGGVVAPGKGSLFSTKVRTISRFATLKLNKWEKLDNLYVEDALETIKNSEIYLHLCEGGKKLSLMSRVKYTDISYSDHKILINNCSYHIKYDMLPAPTCLRCNTTLPKDTQDMLDFIFKSELTKLKKRQK